MLQFATEFPVVSKEGAEFVFLSEIRGWTIESPTTQFQESDLVELGSPGQWFCDTPNELIESLCHSLGGRTATAVQYSASDPEGESVTTAVLTLGTDSAWVSVKKTRTLYSPAAVSHSEEKHVLVDRLLSALGGGSDSEGLLVRSSAHLLAPADLELARRIVSGSSLTRLPVIYVSVQIESQPIVDAQRLSARLWGMAHVLVEPDRAFSNQLRYVSDAKNAYGGTVAIYWPHFGGRRSFFVGQQYRTAAEIESAIVSEVTRALRNSRPTDDFSWDFVQELWSRHLIDTLAAEGSREVEKYVEAFEDELKSKSERLAAAVNEIERLRVVIQTQQVEHAPRDAIVLHPGNERELYPAEFVSIVHDAFADQVSRVREDSRRQHVLLLFAEASSGHGSSSEKRTQLKELLREYRTMTPKIKKGLEQLGFEIGGDGRHYKLRFMGDDRYTFTLPKTGGDTKGGLNATSDISNLLF
jgi:hypothetical protein